LPQNKYSNISPTKYGGLADHIQAHTGIFWNSHPKKSKYSVSATKIEGREYKMAQDSIITIQENGFVKIGSRQDLEPVLKSHDSIFMSKWKGTPGEDIIGKRSQLTGGVEMEAA
jgi:hypothetical protein